MIVQKPLALKLTFSDHLHVHGAQVFESPESEAGCAEGNPARGNEGGDNAVSLTRQTNRGDPFEVRHTPSSHHIATPPGFRSRMLGHPKKELDKDQLFCLYKRAAACSHPACCSFGKREPKACLIMHCQVYISIIRRSRSKIPPRTPARGGTPASRGEGNKWNTVRR